MWDNIETNRQNFNIDWRAEKGSYDEQIEHFYLSEEFADVNFVFNHNGTITIPAHKFALAVASEVFQKEFTYGDETDESHKRSKTLQSLEIKDENLDVDAFKMALLFIYSGYKKLELTGESVLAVLYIAMKYLIKQLKARCADYLLENLNVINIVPVLQYCLDWEVDQRLVEKCREVLRSNINEVLKDEVVETMNEKCLCFMLDDDELNVAEIKLFKAVNCWACKKYLSKLEHVLSFIRFPLMSLKEFVEIVVPSGFLTIKEQRDMMLMIGGQKPIGPTICSKNWPRGRKWRMDSAFEEKPYQIATNFGTRKTQFQIGVRIENFPSYVTSKVIYDTNFVIVNDTKWYISLRLKKYCQNKKKYRVITPSSSDRPDTLGASIIGKQSNEEQEDSSFIVNATFKFKQQSTAKIFRQLLGRIYLSSINDYHQGSGIDAIAKIDDLLNEENGYLVDNSLEILVDVTISECD